MASNSLLSRDIIWRILGVILGASIGTGLVLGYLHWSDSKLKPRFLDPTPVQAVMDKLPQVAVIGQNPGPAGTTEVFIQIPGILNMQSVYVLSDNKTVISGFVLPNIEGKGVPGGQMQLPNGKPTVDPRTPRQNMQKIMQLSGQTQAPVNAKPATETGQVPAKMQPAQRPAPVPAPKAPEGASQTSPDNEDQARSSNQNSDVPVPTPMPETESSDSEGSIDTDQGSHESQGSVEKIRTTADQTVMQDGLRLENLVGSARFRDALASTMKSKPQLQAIKEIKSPKQQQTAYLDLLKNLPAIKQGDGPRNLYVMFDPNCPVCHSYYSEVSVAANAGRVTVHWIPVTIFPERPSSITAGAELLRTLETKGMVAARNMLNSVMTQHGFNDRLNKGFSDSTSSSRFLDQVLTNTGALVMARAETPLIVFETINGNLAVESGIPDGGYLQKVKSQG